MVSDMFVTSTMFDLTPEGNSTESMSETFEGLGLTSFVFRQIKKKAKATQALQRTQARMKILVLVGNPNAMAMELEVVCLWNGLWA